MNILSQFPEENKEESTFKRYFPVIAFMIACFLAMLALAWRICQIPDDLADIEELGEPITIIQEPEEEPIKEEIEEDVEETSNQSAEEIRQKIEHKVRVVYTTQSDDDIIAAVVMAESGSEDLFGKVLVALSILNRCDYYGLSVLTAVSAPNQYSYPYIGEITHDCYRAVQLARENRDFAPKTMMYFRAGTFHTFATPWCSWGGHCFSYLEEEES